MANRSTSRWVHWERPYEEHGRTCYVWQGQRARAAAPPGIQQQTATAWVFAPRALTAVGVSRYRGDEKTATADGMQVIAAAAKAV